MKHVLTSISLLILLTSRALGAPVDFVRDVRPILEKHCYACHGEQKQKSGLRLDVKGAAFQGGELYGAGIVPKQPDKSPLVQFVADPNAELQMPPSGARLSAAEIDVLRRWVNEGAVWPDGVDRVTLEDRRDHWSFKPVASVVPPRTADTVWPRNDIDRFVLDRLNREGLRPAPEADRKSWLRRVSLDLIGLPPTPEQAEAFLQDSRADAHALMVDELLNSPRYGERWAQHWLDVVRYADTHGFEVNTERPNAWPYRDYVIRAFNHDTPYDRFIREQIAADALGMESEPDVAVRSANSASVRGANRDNGTNGEDAATGFLVTASVLLPGQIGADEPSKRLARQDALDEIVVNIGQTFLGLSIGCARCHDHKFDPLTQRDYYGMQAFVAGVEYQDRELWTPEAIARRAEAERFKVRAAEIDKSLARFVPQAKSGAERPMINARENVDRVPPSKAKRVRLTIKATNSLEPCLDELEVFNAAGENIALASQGATATASGSITVADRHELKHLNDGHYGNSRSWMSNETGKGWVVIEFAHEHTIERIAWGRDREGKFKDRLATDYVLEAAGTDGDWRVLADASDRRKFNPDDKSPVPFSTQGLSAEEASAATELMSEKRSLDTKIRESEALKVFAGTFRKPDEIRLLTRGDPEQPKEIVEPAVLSFGESQGLSLFAPRTERRFAERTATIATLPEPRRRLALADWIASPQNPLTARVMVNRVWQGHFGTGLVETASDFGRNGTKPTHPELLDWLATEFIRSGWSVKRLHKLIVLSATYRQSTQFNAVAAEQDADARWLWRFPTRRLDAETIRDSMLAASGRLNLKMYGRGFNVFNQRGGLSGFTPVESFQDEGLRRMIYAHKVRRERDAVFGAFDCPDAGQSAARRRESTTPLQALNLFNSRFTLEQADAFATRVTSDVGDDIERQIRRAYQLTLNRDPLADELAESKTAVTTHGLGLLGRVLFNSNEFLFLP